MGKINNFFEAIYCINLDRRPQKWEQSKDEYKKYEIEGVQRFSAFDGNTLDVSGIRIQKSEYGLVLSNIEIIKKSQSEGLQNVLILEDDCIFTEDIRRFDELINEVPSDWDLLYFGGNHNGHKGIEQPKQISKNVVKIHYTFATHAVAINGKFFYSFLEKISKTDAPLDVMLTDLQKNCNAYCFSPSIAKQRPGYSDIQRRDVNYDQWIK